jgi:hypothetical protein
MRVPAVQTMIRGRRVSARWIGERRNRGSRAPLFDLYVGRRRVSDEPVGRSRVVRELRASVHAMQRAVVVRVTSDDIRRGRRRSFTCCPVARAVKRTLKLGAVHVNPLLINAGGPGENFKTPSTAGRFITKFDAGVQVQPFAFRLSSRRGSARKCHSQGGR